MGSSDTGTFEPCGTYEPGLAFQVCAASYLAGPGADAATSVAIDQGGTVWWGGSIAGSDVGTSPTVLPGATEGAIASLSPDGRALSSITRFGTRVEHLAVAPDGAIVAGGDAGIVVLEPDGASARWSAEPGAVRRVAVDDDSVVALVGGEAHVFGTGGDATGTVDLGGHAAMNDLVLVDERIIVTGFKQDDGPPCTQLQIPFIRAFSKQGDSLWSAYDWDKDTVGAADQCADTRGLALALGGDGLLYYAGESHGGNSVHHRRPDDIDADAPNVKTDSYDDPYGLNGAAPIAYYARLDPADGELLLGQFLLTRLSDGKGNAARPREIAADAAGHVYVVGGTACCIQDGSQRTVNGAPAMPEEYQGGGFLLVAAPDFSSRLTWTTFRGTTGNGETAVSVATAAGNVAVAIDQQLEEGSTTKAPLLTFDGLIEGPPGGPGDGYVTVFPSPAAP